MRSRKNVSATWWGILVTLSLTMAPGILVAAPPEAPKDETVVEPKLVSPAQVEYPSDGQVSCRVHLRLLISENGEVMKAEVEEVVAEEAPADEGGAPMGEADLAPFREEALRASQSWEFTPARVQGKPKAAFIRFWVAFEKPEEAEEPLPAAESGAVKAVGEAAPPSSKDEEVIVAGVRRPGTTRVLSDAESEIVVGAEGDPVRAIEAMPGTVPILASGPFLGIRGGSPGMSGYEYDGISLPYLFHLGRSPAVVHPWLVESAAIYATAGPARLGRATAGTIEAVASEPEGRRRASARVRLTDAALGVEMPFAEGRGTVLAAGRYSYTQALVQFVAPDFTLNYWDYQTRVNYRLGSSDQIEVLGFGAGDLSAQDLPDGSTEDIYNASFHRARIQFRHRAEDGSEGRISLIYGHDRWDAEPAPIKPHSHEITLRVDGSRPRSELGLSGAELNYGSDGTVRFQTDQYFTGPDQAAEYERQDVTVGAWADLNFQVSQKTVLALGLRADLYATGASPRSLPASDGALQPRWSLSHQISEVVRLHQAIGFAAQRPSPSQRPPGRLLPVSFGLERSVLSDLGVEFALPLGVSFDTTAFHNVYFETLDAEHLQYIRDQAEDPRALGHASGLEFSLKRMLAPRLRGFLSYTLSRSVRALGRVRGLAQFDRGHVVDLALAYFLGKGWNATSRVTYYSGFPARVGEVAAVSSAPRATPYVQLDAQVKKRWDVGDSGAWWGVTMGVLNANLRSDVNDYYCDRGECVEEMVGPATIPTFGVEGEL